MKVCVFRSIGGARGLTKDEEGTNLPANIGPWVFEKIVELDEEDHGRIGINSVEALRLIEKDGYYIRPS